MKPVFQADDGAVFNSAAKCGIYERQLKKDRAKEKLAKLCGELCEAIDLDPEPQELGEPEDIYKAMAEHMIENIRTFGAALAPFIPREGKRI